MTALCSQWGADVVCFEPNYRSWPVIKAVYDANGLKPPLANFCGFASDKTQLEPRNPDKAIYGGRQWELRSDGWPVCVEGEIVEAHGFNQLFEEADGLPQTTIDDFVERTGIIPTVITMDTEGSEGRILRGAEQTLRAHKPKLWISIHPEFLIQSYGEYSRDVRNWIINLGYEETLLAWEHEAHVMYFPKGVV
jgi:FkbM family methyltransferase